MAPRHPREAVLLCAASLAMSSCTLLTAVDRPQEGVVRDASCAEASCDATADRDATKALDASVTDASANSDAE